MSRKKPTTWKFEDIQQLVDNYESGLSIPAVAAKIGRGEPSVREYLYELRNQGLILQSSRIYPDDWSNVEDEYLLENYGIVSTKSLAKDLNRSISAINKRKQQLDQTSSLAKFKRKRKNLLTTRYGKIAEENSYVRAGFRPALGVSVRSGWENNVLAYLNYKKIKWEYEPRQFIFEEVSRGAKSYLPDIYLPPPHDKWIEVKGRLLSVSKTKTRRFKQFYPEEFAKLEVVVKKGSEADKFYKTMGVPVYAYYDDLEKNYSHIPNWETKKK